METIEWSLSSDQSATEIPLNTRIKVGGGPVPSMGCTEVMVSALDAIEGVSIQGSCRIRSEGRTRERVDVTKVVVNMDWICHLLRSVSRYCSCRP